MSVPTNNPQLSGYPGAHNPQGASPYQGATPYQGSAQQGASPYQGATPYQGSAQQGASPYPGGLPQSYPGSAPQPYGGAQTQASTKKIPTAFILGIAVWVAIFLIIGVTALMIWSSADESASERSGIAVIPMFGFLVVVPPLVLFGLITGGSANKRLMTRKQLIMNRIGIGLSVAPFVAFFLLYAGIIIAEMVERGL
ncbi:hypothetical protein [uncultured Actinomyces sp.]|uniref:hypothetical protein n=1 Tax=uncultured Actinomyces sp. TaxID=249061 RepID=UPI0025ED329D|nr:hypothetical protein [uncultured Actinomyces sp.]